MNADFEKQTNSDPGVQQVVDKKLLASQKATDDYYALRAKASAIFATAGASPGETLDAWALGNYPPLDGAQKTMVGANQAYLDALGFQLGTIAAQRGRDHMRIDRALLSTPTEYVCINDALTLV